MGNAFNPYEAPKADNQVNPFEGHIRDARHASRGTRFVHLLIDSVCRTILGAIMGAIASTANEPLLAVPLSIASLLGYYIFFEGVFQATPGKFITRTRVVDLDGNKPTLWQIVGRTLSRFVPFEPFSFFSSTEEGWHDRWSGTRVVHVQGR
jgi:uncharacterized RDD family membrane protein YckC